MDAKNCFGQENKAIIKNRKYQLETAFWITFAVVLLIGLGSIPLKQSITVVVFIILALVMLIFNEPIISILWVGLNSRNK